MSGETEPGVWYPEEHGALRSGSARLRVVAPRRAGLQQASIPGRAQQSAVAARVGVEIHCHGVVLVTRGRAWLILVSCGAGLVLLADTSMHRRASSTELLGTTRVGWSSAVLSRFVP